MKVGDMVKLAVHERSYLGELGGQGSVGIVVEHKFWAWTPEGYKLKDSMSMSPFPGEQFHNEWTVLIHGIMIDVDDCDIKERRAEVLRESEPGRPDTV